jgi:hypothetical protein
LGTFWGITIRLLITGLLGTCMRVSVNEITGDGSAIFLDGTFVPSLWVAKLLEVENGEQRKLLLAFSIGDLKANK